MCWPGMPKALASEEIGVIGQGRFAVTLLEEQLLPLANHA